MMLIKEESDDDDNLMNNNNDDWRSFRAKLVLDETTTATTDSPWAYDAGLLVQKGSLIVSRIESSLGCHDLRQPYFFYCSVSS